MAGKHRFYRVIKRLNYFQPGWIGFLMKNCDTLPLSKNLKSLCLFEAALEKLLADDALVLVYPEQAMWWNYRKSRPPKAGAYHYAAKFNVPIIPVFVTMEDTDALDEHNFPKQKYTIHIMPPMYPDPEKRVRENVRAMQAKKLRPLPCQIPRGIRREIGYMLIENRARNERIFPFVLALFFIFLAFPSFA